MNHIRKHQLTGAPIIFAPKRGLRPHDFQTKDRIQKVPKDCPFCTGHEDQTPPEICTLPKRLPKNTPGWLVRTIPNKYSALSQGEKAGINGAYGYHQVVVTKDHNTSLADLPPKVAQYNIEAYINCCKEIRKDKKIQYIQIIYNHGPTAGASLSHPHSQLFALDFVPPLIKKENTVFTSYYKKHKRHLLQDIIKHEIQEKKRVLKETKHFLLWCPYGSQAKFEMQIAPKKHTPFCNMNAEKQKEFGLLLKYGLKKLKKVLNNPDFNFYLHTAPVNTKADYTHFHWHLEILPKLGIWAGFELGTGVIINSVLPEDAAKMLKK